MKNSAVQVANVAVCQSLFDFINNEAIPNTGIESAHFWEQLSVIATDLIPENRALLAKRNTLQQQIDAWYQQGGTDPVAHKEFLQSIGYLSVEQEDDFCVDTAHVDYEITDIAGPQLVVPVNNARYALNATNARWGSLYDALYGTDVIDEHDGKEKGSAFNPKRGHAVTEYVMRLLIEWLPLQHGTLADATAFYVHNGALHITVNGEITQLHDDAVWVGYQGKADSPSALLFKHHNLHIELLFDKSHPVGKRSPCGLKDVVLESAVTTIQDCEDSVAAVDAEDKVLVYRNWLGLMLGTLSETVHKNGITVERTLNPNKAYSAPDGSLFELSARSLLLCRNVGHLMTNPAIIMADGSEIPEGIMDCMVTALCALHDLTNRRVNSQAGSMYIVKPKMHGPEEVAFAVKLFGRVERALGLAENTLKIGIMDEERRTSINLRACIRAAKSRIVFINTGFLDRTGDELHTAMYAGAMLPKGDMKTATWLQAYEKANVIVGLQCGLPGHAQIGKGMWAMPDEMARMMQDKVGHPASGANTAWVPSPTAATLHAIHYHQVDVLAVQQQLMQECLTYPLDALLTIPILNTVPSSEAIAQELDSNCQSILGYVVRWIDQGIGCSKVPDINHVGLMEDRATLRISSQLLANWLLHGLITKEQVSNAMQRMAAVVDAQNAHDAAYTPMAPECDGPAFTAACALVFNGATVENGYTEPALHHFRLLKKMGNTSVSTAE